MNKAPLEQVGCNMQTDGMGEGGRGGGCLIASESLFCGDSQIYLFNMVLKCIKRNRCGFLTQE